MADISDLFKAFKTSFVDTYKNHFGGDEITARAFVDTLVNDIINNYAALSISPLLHNQLTNLADKDWSIDLSTTNAAQTEANNKNPKIKIPIHDLPLDYNSMTASAQQVVFNKIEKLFVGELSHELGHAEDFQGNNLTYVADPALENGLSIGAQLALNLLSEGKGLYNNIQIQREIFGNSLHTFDIPVIASHASINSAQNGPANAAVINGAQHIYNDTSSGTGTRYVEAIWGDARKSFNDSQTYLANRNVLSALTIDMKKVRPPETINGVETTGVTFTPHSGATEAQSTITMTVRFNDGYKVLSYINTFGNYGTIAASRDGTVDGDGVVNIITKSPSPPDVVTYQRFNYANGTYLLDEYNVNIDGTIYNQAVRFYSKANPSDLSNDIANTISAGDQLKFGQYDRVINGVLNVNLVGDGAIATLSNVAAITLEHGAKATVFGTNNTITLNGSNTLKMGISEGVGGNTGNLIKNFGTDDVIEFLGVGKVSGTPVIDANGLLTLHTSNTVNNITTYSDVSVQLEPAPYLRALDLSAQANGGAAKITAALNAGYHIVQAGETASSIAASYGIAEAVLQEINSVFADSDFNAGGIVHVPVGVGNAANLMALLDGQTYVYNPLSDTTFIVASSLDGHDNGALIIDPSVASPLFKKGTYSSVSKNFGNGDITVGLTTANGVAVGSIVLNLTSNAGTFYLSSGYSIPVSNISALNLTAPAAASSPVDAVVNYLSQFGTQVSQQQLSDLNEAFLNPTGSGYTVTGVVTNTSTPTTDSANETFSLINAAPGAVVQGSAQVTITNYVTVYNEFNQPVQVAVQVTVDPTNILNASGNISQDNISNIDVLNVLGGNITLNASQLASFGDVRGSGTVNAASSGVYDFRASNISGTFDTLTATSWNGTTIYGNDQNGQVLKASAFGNDTLVAGDGTNDKLYAGGGINTLIGGNGGDTFYAAGGLAAGSVITGHGSNNRLYADGNIAGATISGVQTLMANGIYFMPDFTAKILSGSVTLNNSAFNNFNSIEAYNITTGSGGIYNFDGKFANAVNVLVGSDAGTEIITNDFAGNTVKTSALGNDTLIGGAGASTTLSANDSHGNNTLVSNGLSNTLSANNSTGDNHLTANGNSYQTLSANGSSGSNVLLAGSDSYGFISVDDSTGNNALTATAGTLSANNSSGNNVLNIANGSANANNSFGDNTLNVASGSAAANYSSGNNHLTVTDGTASADYSGGFNILNSVSGTLSADHSTGNNTLTSTSGSVRANASFGNNTLSTDSGNASVNNSFGDNVLTSVTGALNADNSDGDNHLTTGNGSVSANNSRGNNILHAGQGNAAADYSSGDNLLSITDSNGGYLTANYSTGDNTLLVGDGGNAGLQVYGSQGNNTLTAGMGDGYLLNVSSSSGDNIVTAGDGNNIVLYAIDSNGNNTLTAGNGNFNTLNANTSHGNNILTSGYGNSVFVSADNSTGNNTLVVGNGSNDRLSAISSTGNNTLIAGSGGYSWLNVSYSTGNNTLTADGDNNNLSAYNATGNNTFKVFNGNNNQFTLNNTTGDNTFIVGDGNNNSLNEVNSTGHNTFTVGNGSNNLIETGTGVSTITIGSGENNLIFAERGLAAGSNITSQNYTTSTLQANGDISGATISGIANLTSSTAPINELNGVKLNAAQLAGFKNINVTALYAATGGTYDLTGKGVGLALFATATTGTTLIAGTQQSLIASSSGNDTLSGDANNLLDANNTSGNNTLTGGAGGNNHLSALNSTGNNTLVVSGGVMNSIDARGSSGHNILDASGASAASVIATSTFLYAGNGGDTIIGGLGTDYIAGGSGNDAITGNGGADNIDAGAGDDTVSYDQASVLISGGAGNDTLLLSQTTATTVQLGNVISQVTGSGQVSNFENIDGSGSSASLNITGDDYANVLKGGSGDDIIDGGAATDTINGGAGNDIITFDGVDISIDGGLGLDTLIIKGNSSIAADLGGLINQVAGSAVVTGFENIDATMASGALSLTGDGNDNLLKGGSGADSIYGGAGSDSFYYDANDLIADGGDGNDTLVLSQGMPTTVNLSNNINQIMGGGTVINFENIDGGSSTAALTIMGDANANTLITGSGDDIIDGGAGADIINSGSGNDAVTYDASDASVDGATGIDTLVVSGNTAFTADLSNQSNQISGTTIIVGIENIDASANAAAVSIIGDNGDNILKGGSGADNIIGGGGNDTLTYDVNDVLMDGESGNDTLVLNQNIATTINLSSTVNQVVGGGTTINFENIDGSASVAALNVVGDLNANIIKGGSGNDTLFGGGGADSVYGGAGNDIITYNAADVLEDGGTGNDTLVVNQGVVSINIGNPSGRIFINVALNQYVAGFETIDASASTGGLFVSGQLNGSTVKGGSGNDQYNFADAALTGTIIGGGGVDVLQVNGDITGASISGVNTLLSLGGVKLNASQLAGFNLIASGTHLYAATGGVYDMTGRGTTGDVLEATVNTGTTLIAGSTSGQTLIASEFGTDILTIGNGDNDVVVAGKGINYITMGTGNNDVVIANNGLAAGSTVLMKNTTTSKLQVNGDISGATIAGVNTISSTTGVTLTSSQLAGLKFVANNSILYAATGGTYSLNGGRGSFGNQLHATVNTGTTLIAGNAQSMSLYASALGNDTLTIGTGNNDTVYAGGGINIITMGNGTGDRVIAAQGLAAGSSVTMGNTADSLLLAEGNISGATLTGIHTLGSTSGVTLNATQLNNFATINANTILNAATGGTYDLTGKGDVGGTLRATSNTGTTLIGGADNQTLIASATGQDTLIAGNGNNVTLIGGNGGNTLTGGNGVNTIIAGSGNDIIMGGLAADIITAGAGNDTVTFDANDVSVDGGTAIDTLILSGGSSIAADLANATNQIAGSTVVTGFENLDGSAVTASLSLTGDAGANTLIGGSANDTLVGGGGADSLYGNDGDDSITYNAMATLMDGGAGNNTLVLNQAIATTVDLTNAANIVAGGGSAINFANIDAGTSTAALTITGDANGNILSGGAGDDIIIGGAGADTINGGAGSDTVIYDAGDISIDGGVGADTLILNGSSAITVNLSNSNQVTGAAIVTGFENIDASAVTAAVSLTGDAGNNILKGSAVADTINGGDGNDTVIYDTLDATVDGGAGVDTLVLSGTAAITANLTSAIDQVTGGGKAINFENLDASAVTANVNFTGSINANILTGGSGNDTLNAGAGADSIYGNAGNDSITYDALDILADAGAGTDTLIVNGSASVAIDLANLADQISSDAGITTGFEYVNATALIGDLTLSGDAGVNNLKGGSGFNTIDGGAGNDTITGGTNNDTLYGGDGNDIINGGAGVDSIYGGAGNDTITFNSAAAVLDGGDGVDTLVLTGSETLVIDLANTLNQVSSAGIVTGFETINASAYTGNFAVTGDNNANNLRGGVGSNIIYGLGGNDTITGGANNDTLYGGDGNDSINGSGGADSIYGEAGNDTITYNANAVLLDGGDGTDTLTMTGSAALTIDLTSTTNQIVGGTATILNFENISAAAYTGNLTITGSAGTNTLRGGSGINTIYGGSSNDSITGGANTDTLYGGDGNDTIVGGIGADSIYGEAGNDSITYDAADAIIDGGADIDTLTITGSAALTIDLSNAANQIAGGATVVNFENITATAYTGALTITGSGVANTLRGGSGVNTIIGGAGNDAITGGANNDILTGGLSNDSLTGGLGNDTYNFTRGDGADTIVENDATIGNHDVLAFASGVNYDQLWFKKISNNLEVSVIGTMDKVTISNWFLSTDRQVESIQAGGEELVNSNVINLVNAMAGMTAPTAGQTTLTAAQHAALDPVIAANWHAA